MGEIPNDYFVDISAQNSFLLQAFQVCLSVFYETFYCKYLVTVFLFTYRY